MTGATGLAPIESDAVRPDIPIPMVGLSGPARLLQRLTVGWSAASFDRARRMTTLLAIIATAILVAGDTIVATPYSTASRAVAALVGAYAALRAVMLLILERRQAGFEPRWLAQRSAELRRHPFEVLRFSAQSDSDNATTNWGFFDLTKPEDVRELLRIQALERRGRLRSRAVIEFAYDAGEDGSTAVESVSRRLSDIEIQPADGHPGRAWVRFPDATYGSRPTHRFTYWFLSGPVRMTTAPPAPPPAGSPG